MRFRLKKIITSTIKISRKSFYLTSFFIIAIIIISTSIYLYKFVYKSIIYTEKNIKLQKIVSTESLDIKDFDTILKNIQEKVEHSNADKMSLVNNFFVEVRSKISTSTPPIQIPTQIE